MRTRINAQLKKNRSKVRVIHQKAKAQISAQPKRGRKKLRISSGELFLLPLLGLMLAGFSSNVLIDNDALVQVLWCLACVSVIVIAWVVSNRAFWQTPMKDKILGLIGIPLGLMMIFLVSVPSLLHYITAKEGGVIIVTVDQIWNDKYCRRGFSVAEFSLFTNKVCKLSDDEFRQLTVGAKVELTGTTSRFGFNPKRYQIFK